MSKPLTILYNSLGYNDTEGESNTPNLACSMPIQQQIFDCDMTIIGNSYGDAPTTVVGSTTNDIVPNTYDGNITDYTKIVNSITLGVEKGSNLGYNAIDQVNFPLLTTKITKNSSNVLGYVLTNQPIGTPTNVKDCVLSFTLNQSCNKLNIGVYCSSSTTGSTVQLNEVVSYMRTTYVEKQWILILDDFAIVKNEIIQPFIISNPDLQFSLPNPSFVNLSPTVTASRCIISCGINVNSQVLPIIASYYSSNSVGFTRNSVLIEVPSISVCPNFNGKQAINTNNGYYNSPY